MIRGAIRNRWAAQGWETGPLGYPVQDEHRYVTIDSARDPNTAWSLFENGAVVTSGGNTDVACTVEVSPDKLRCLVRQEFDRVTHESPDNVGLHAPSETIAVSPNYPRAVTFGIHSFHDDGLLSDTDFDITVALRFGLTWEAEGFTEAETKNLAVSLVSASITAHGVSARSGRPRCSQRNPERFCWAPHRRIATPRRRKYHAPHARLDWCVGNRRGRPARPP